MTGGSYDPVPEPSRASSLPVLELAGVTRNYGGRPVWTPVDLHLAAATTTVVTGPNGSGKSTLLRLAAGLLRPSTGVRRCAGRALYVRGGSGPRSAQTVSDAVAAVAGLAGCRARTPAALALVGMHGWESRRVGSLSAGERVRIALAVAWATEPAVLCLDEPTAVLDERGVSDLVGVLRVMREAGCATLVATHQPERLLSGADMHLRFEARHLVAAG